MAEVFLARAAGPMGFQKTLVVKRILPHYAEDPSFVEMFLAEARIAAELNHPNIVQIFDFGREANTFFIAMEHIDGPNLRALEKRAKKTGLKMPFHLAAKIISLACDGLAFAHDHTDPETGQPLNLIHRDVSPDNILVSRSGGVKVVDFGIAKANTNKRGITKAGLVKGKMAYMSPEQLANEPLDRRSDVFALGIVFYELLTGGEVPFDDRNDALIVQSVMGPEPLWSLTKFRPDAPVPLVRILARTLEKDVSRRYPSCKALQADLERFIVSVGKPVQGSELAELVRTLEADRRPEVSAGSMLTEPGEEPPPEVEAAGGGDVWSQVPDSPELEADYERTTRDPFERTTQDPFDGVQGDPSDNEKTARQPFVPDPPNSDTPLD
ncbi:MAG TPA: serine/threonine-protein kinase, partial [Myxococcaceae bacterium]|nr:serine/threonine-protein kinase [Myxococcaceae bacterium]